MWVGVGGTLIPQGPFSQFGKYAYLPIAVGPPVNGSYL